MTTTLLLHPASEKLLASTRQDLPQSLLISGQRGVGLSTIARWLAGNQLAGKVLPQDTKANTDSGNGTISVEAVRNLYEQTRAKYTTGQVIIIDDADRMSHGAQNAFLKLLEEPNEHVYFILTSHSPQQLLPTIRSRVQHTVIHPVPVKQTAEFIASLGKFDEKKQAQLQFIASGLPAELLRLAGDEAYFQERARVFGDARGLLQSDPYNKLLIIHKYKPSRTKALQLCDSALYILRRSISQKPQPALVSQLDRLLSVRERIDSNHNIALSLALFVL